jgi:Xaa-Pro aminopeptidase
MDAPEPRTASSPTAGASATSGSSNDAELARFLSQEGARLALPGLRDLVAGVIAAPPAVDPEAWIALVAAKPTPALRAALLRLEIAMRERATDGLGVRPAPPERLAALRAELNRRGVDGFLVPLAGEHQSEFPPARARRLEWLTGFGGSAGLAIVLRERAAIFVDGRYTLQVRAQVDTTLFEPRHITDEPPADWLAAAMPSGGRLGYDPWLHTSEGLQRLADGCKRCGATLLPLEPNPIDSVWTDQPARPIAPVVPQPIEMAGRSSVEKRVEAAAALREAGADAALLTAPDSIAWLLNIRGGDVPHTPVALSFALLGSDGEVKLFIDGRKLTDAARAHLGNGVALCPPEALGPALDALGAERRTVQLATGMAPSWAVDRLERAGARLLRRDDPCTLPKACKNAVELMGMRAAHIRDGASLCRFLSWLADETPNGRIDEIAAAEQLYRFRCGNDLFRGLSFDTISGSGPNGAVVHYHVGPQTNRRLGAGELYLIDSGAQYLDGTTDVTRTVAIGAPTHEMRDRFTRVLKGHIAIATVRFPAGTSGGQLDALARLALWEAGLDFDHGTGHGVGHFLAVHEGPHRIAKRLAEAPLRPGMVVSNEPGYYKAGAYGIRIENLEVVRAAPPIPGAERETLQFESLTLAPIDRALIDTTLLRPDEIDWLDRYHARVQAAVGPLVDARTRRWLEDACAPILRRDT